VTEHVVLTGCLSSIPAIYSFTNDNVWELSQLLIRLPKHTNHAVGYLCTKYMQAQANQAIPMGRDMIFARNENFGSMGFRCCLKATDKPNVTVNICQNYNSGTEFTNSRDSENGVQIRLLTSHNGKSRNSAI